MNIKKSAWNQCVNLLFIASFVIVVSLGYIPAAFSSVTKVAVYRGAAGCEGCSEMVVKSLKETGLNLDVSYVGEQEVLKLNPQNLKKYDLYIQPGGGQDIPAAYKALGEEGVEAIRSFVSSGKGYLGICMGAYLADKDWIGLINAPLDSEVGRPNADALDEGDYTFSILWGEKEESVYFQDGPYFDNSTKSLGFVPIAHYLNGDIAMASYKYGKGKVVLTGPHPEADESWIDVTKPGYIPAKNKMIRLLKFFDIANK